MRIGAKHRMQGLKNVRRLVGAGVAGLGFILSPLSWWNDAIVNIPLALLAARLASDITGLDMGVLFAFFYWLTNIMGIVMMFIGSSYSVQRSVSKRSVAIGIAASILYTVVVLVLIE